MGPPYLWLQITECQTVKDSVFKPEHLNFLIAQILGNPSDSYWLP